ncbi:MFS multidrug transporter-like protein [Byssothecium circinans]|uniref:MFS multidrug transporter-like protein n=1 Tax=Byssothecium circinans TaxID=147558 RepID=A0A6A5UDJ7_9PLEO|nr:MFS multidrug transporter-like protein [Byssothecium circinans]
MNALAEEQQPLLGPILEDAEDAISVRHGGITEILDFEVGDKEDPRQWAKSFRWFIVLLLACMAFTVTFTCIGVVPVATRIVDELSGPDASTTSTSALLVTIWELGEAAGPLVTAPLSELFGRYPVMNICNLGFIFFTLLAVSSKSTSLFIVARMLTGVTVASNVLNPAIIGDLFDSDERGSAMSLIMLAPLVGGAVGPAISGAIAQTLGWRWVLLIATGLAVCCEILFLACFRETYKMSILKKRARKLQEQNEGYDEVAKSKNGSGSDVKKLWHAITRPFAVLFGSKVLILLSLFGSVAFSFFYVLSTSLPNILQDFYDFTPAQIGSAFMTFSVGSFLGVLVCNTLLDRIYIYLRSQSPTKSGRPEHRLPLSIIGGALLPLSVAAYGWIAQTHLPVVLLLGSVGFQGFTLLLAMIPLSAYVVDAFGNYSASAMTGVVVTRCLMGTFLPLATGPLAEWLGWGWGCTCLAALSAVLAVCPVLVARYGVVWRRGSEFTRDT